MCDTLSTHIGCASASFPLNESLGQSVSRNRATSEIEDAQLPDADIKSISLNRVDPRQLFPVSMKSDEELTGGGWEDDICGELSLRRRSNHQLTRKRVFDCELLAHFAMMPSGRLTRELLPQPKLREASGASNAAICPLPLRRHEV